MQFTPRIHKKASLKNLRKSEARDVCLISHWRNSDKPFYLRKKLYSVLEQLICCFESFRALQCPAHSDRVFKSIPICFHLLRTFALIVYAHPCCVIHVAMSRHVMYRALALSKKYRQINSLKCTVTPIFSKNHFLYCWVLCILSKNKKNKKILNVKSFNFIAISTLILSNFSTNAGIMTHNYPSRIIWRSSQWRCFNLSSWKEETWKNSGLNGNRSHDLCDTSAAL